MTNEYKPAETADKVRSGDVDANIDAILSDDATTGDVILAAERAGLDEDSPLYSILSRKETTDAIRAARLNDDASTLNAVTGLSESRTDATGYDMLVKALKPAAQQVVVKGPKGTGKTTKAIDLAKRLWQEFDGELSILTNIKGPDEHPDVTYADTISGMLEWVRDTDGEKLVIGDEWSTEVNAHAHGGGLVRETFSQFINALRKGEGGSTRLIAIGHEHDTDLAAILRNQSDAVIQADGKVDEGLIDCATVYRGWKAYKQDDVWFRVKGLQDIDADQWTVDAEYRDLIPDEKVGEWGFDTNYFATFDLDLDNPSKQIQKGKLVEDWEKYQDDADEDADDPGEEAGEAKLNDPVACSGHNTDGSRCRDTTKHPSGYCAKHRAHQWDGESFINDDSGTSNTE